MQISSNLLFQFLEHLQVNQQGLKINSIENAFFSIICKLEFVGITTFLKLEHLENAAPHILETFCKIKSLLIFVFENSYDENDFDIFWTLFFIKVTQITSS